MGYGARMIPAHARLILLALLVSGCAEPPRFQFLVVDVPIEGTQRSGKTVIRIEPASGAAWTLERVEAERVPGDPLEPGSKRFQGWVPVSESLVEELQGYADSLPLPAHPSDEGEED